MVLVLCNLNSTIRVPIPNLEKLIKDLMECEGYNQQEVNAIVELVLFAQIRGNNQGLSKLAGKGIVRDPQAKFPVIEKETAVSARINGCKSIGMLAMQYATDVAMQKVQSSGVGIVTVHNICSSTGAIGYYAQKLAQHGFVGIIMAQSPELVAPHGSFEPILGTNPIAFGIPRSRGRALTFDMATSAIAYYGRS